MKLKKLCTHKMESDVTKPFACSYSEDNKLAIISNNGIEIMELKHDPNESDIVVATRWSHVILTTNLPTSAASKDISMEIAYNLERNDLIDLILNGELFPNHTRAKPPDVDISQVKWSPKGLHSRSRCLFTTLNNRGECIIWAYISNEWISLASPSEKFNELFDLEVLTNLDFKLQLAQLRKNVKELFITSIEWSPLLNDFAFLATGHASGKIFFWKVESYDSFKNKELSINKETFFLDLKDRINLLKWHQCENCFYLFAANIKGQAFLIPLEINNSNLDQSRSPVSLWDDDDGIIIGHCLIRNNDKEIIIIFSKQQHLFHVRLSKEGLGIIKKEHFLIGLITGLEMLDINTVILTSHRGYIYKLDLVNNTGINKPEQIDNLRLENYTCLGLSAGNLRQFWFFILRSYHPQLVKSSGEIRVFSKTDLCTFENNKPLWTQMEVLESIRHNCIQTGNILGIEKTKDPDWIENCTPGELKQCLHLVLIAIAHEDTRDNEGRNTELLESSKKIKIHLSIIHACWLKKRLSSIWQNNSASFSNLNYTTIWTLCNLIIDEATKSGIQKVNKEILPGPDLCTEKCIICEEPITISIADDGLYKAVGSCKHNVNRCSFTFRQIGLESIMICENCPGVYACTDCELLASPDLPKCIYCDSFLEYDEHQH